jgi:lauroyl/myristoyl acyltransferase
MGITSLLQDGFVSLGARGIGRMTPEFRSRVAQQMALHWLSVDQRFSNAVALNLASVFPEHTVEERKALASASAHRTARAQLDHFWAWHARRDHIVEAVELEGFERLIDATPGDPVVVAGAHRIGFELVLIRLSIELEGAVIYDAGATPLPRAARRAWSRFKPQQVIAARGALQPALHAVRQGVPLLVLADEPANDLPADTARVLASRMRFSPIVSFLARRCGARVLWVDFLQLGPGRYRAVLGEPLSAAQANDRAACAAAMAARLEKSLRTDPSGYWWGRKSIAGVRPQRREQIAAKARAIAPGQSGRVG